MDKTVRKTEQPESITASLFPDDVLTVELVPGRVKGDLYPEEAALITSARENRKEEFIAGRLGARQLLDKLGLRDYPLISGKAREPLWPENVVGSISHTDGICAVAVAEKAAYAGLGLDLEKSDGVKKKMWSHLFLPEEQAWLNKRPEKEQDRHATLIFSAKESFYKCQYFLTREWLHFKEARIRVDLSNQRFDVKVVSKNAEAFPADATFQGTFRFNKDRVYTGMTSR